MSKVRDGWVFKMTIVNLSRFHESTLVGPTVLMEMPFPGENEKRYIQPVDEIILDITTDRVGGRPIEDKYYVKSKDSYYIYEGHPNILTLQEFYNDGEISTKALPLSDKRAGSRRRRPSRKYKKSKRVLRRKSRSTRRR